MKLKIKDEIVEISDSELETLLFELGMGASRHVSHMLDTEDEQRRKGLRLLSERAHQLYEKLHPFFFI